MSDSHIPHHCLTASALGKESQAPIGLYGIREILITAIGDDIDFPVVECLRLYGGDRLSQVRTASMPRDYDTYRRHMRPSRHQRALA
jgi:hypothetical protein